MGKKRGRPKKGTGAGKDRLLQVRLSDAEKKGFAAAAVLAGEGVSVWARGELRRAAQALLQEHGQEVPFLPTKTEESST